jgi:hypothetical protein
VEDGDPGAAEAALTGLARDLVRELGAAAAAGYLALASDRAEGEGTSGSRHDQPGPAVLPGLCDSPFCDHLTLRCPRNRVHLVGGSLAHRQHLISRGSSSPPPQGSDPRGAGGAA